MRCVQFAQVCYWLTASLRPANINSMMFLHMGSWFHYQRAIGGKGVVVKVDKSLWEKEVVDFLANFGFLVRLSVVHRPLGGVPWPLNHNVPKSTKFPFTLPA